MLIALFFLSLPPLLFILSGISDGLGRQARAARLRRWAWVSFAGLPIGFFVSRNAVDHLYRAMACEQVVLAEDEDNSAGTVEIAAWSETCRRGETPTYYVAVRFGGWLFGQWWEVVTSEVSPVPVAVSIGGSDPAGNAAFFEVGLAEAPSAEPSRFLDLEFDIGAERWMETYHYRRGFRVEGE